MTDLLDFPRAMALIGEANFEEVFLEELQNQDASIEMERFVANGGWPDDESVNFSVQSVTDREGKCIVRVMCLFNELVSTGCADLKHSSNGIATFDIVLDPKDGLAYAEYLP